MRRIIIGTFLLFTLSTSSVFAQLLGQARLDSLIKELPRQKEDTNKVNLFYALSFSYTALDPDNGIRYATLAEELSNKIPWKKGTGIAKLAVGANYRAKSNFPRAIEFFFSALKIFEELGFKSGMAKCYDNLGMVYLYQGEYAQSLEYTKKALHGYEETGDKAGIARSYMNIGSVNWWQSAYTQAIEWYSRSLKINEEIGDKKQTALVYNNLGGLYRDMGNYPQSLEYQFRSLKYNEELQDKKGAAGNYTNIGNVYLDQKEYPKALQYYFKASENYKGVGNKNGTAVVLGNIGLIYMYQKEYANALKYDQAALKIYEESGDQNGISRNECNIASVYSEQNNLLVAMQYATKALKGFRMQENRTAMGNLFMMIGQIYFKAATRGIVGQLSTLASGSKSKALHSAKIYADSAILIAKETGNLNELTKCYETLSEIMAASGNYKGALDIYVSFKKINDSVFNMEKDKKITQTSMQYEFDKKVSIAQKEQEKKNALAMQELRRQKLMRNSFIGGFALMMLFSGIFLRQRNKITKGKKLSDELLLNILPEEIAEELKAKGSTEAKLIDEVTVLFTDFKGFTQLSEKLSPKELVREINTCFSAFDNIMQKHGVEKIKTIGDAYMAAGGLPTPNKTHAEDVVNAAMEIQDFMHRHKHEREAEGKLFFEIRIGVHTGPVVAGIVGIKKFAYDIWGDTVNTASRMESSGSVGMVNISETTYELVKDKFSCEYRGEVEAKGKGVMRMYYVG